MQNPRVRLAGVLVVITSAAIASCIGQPKEGTRAQAVLAADRTMVDIGLVQVGSTGSSGPITLSNEFTSDDNTITSIAPAMACPDFVLNFNPDPAGYHVFCDDGTGSGGGSGSGGCIPNAYTFEVMFAPTGPGLAGCTLVVSYDLAAGGSDSFTINVMGTGQAPTDLLAINPAEGATLHFGDIPVTTTSSPLSVQITNIGTEALAVTAANSNPEFQITAQAPATYPDQALAPTETAIYDIACAPTAVGQVITGSVTFTSAAPPVTVNYDCTGISASMLTIDPVPASFASAVVGKAPTDLSITITNTGVAATILSVTLVPATSELTFAAGGNPNGASLGAGSSVFAKLHYAAATDHPVGQLGTLEVNYTGGESRTIAISGEALTAALGVSSGSSIEFGPVCVGATASQDLSVYASGAAPVQILQVTPPAAPFTATSPSGSLVGSHGNALMWSAGVAPTAPGELTGTIAIRTDLPTDPVREIMLHATALPAGVTPTPAQVHFGAGRVAMTTVKKTVTVSNCGAGPLAISAARIEGEGAAEFALVSEVPATPIGQRASTTFDVVMTPRTNGAKAAQLVIDSDGGTLTIPLDGNGFAGDESTGTRGTYYTCSAGGTPGAAAGAALPIGLAVLVLRRRRRR